MHVYKYSKLYCIDCTLELLNQEAWWVRGKMENKDSRTLIRGNKYCKSWKGQGHHKKTHIINQPGLIGVHRVRTNN